MSANPPARSTWDTAGGPLWATPWATSWHSAATRFRRSFISTIRGARSPLWADRSICATGSCRVKRSSFPRTSTRETTSERSPPLCAKQRVRSCAPGRTRGRAALCAVCRRNHPPVHRQDLENFGVEFDRWYSEQSLFDSARVSEVIGQLQVQGFVYENDGALWFNTTRFGDEKDRVVVRSNGQTTYFASDIAYHIDKYQRGLPPGHRCVGRGPSRIHPPDVGGHSSGRNGPRPFSGDPGPVGQPAAGRRTGGHVTRSGEFVTLKEVVDEVGRDAARFLFLTATTTAPSISIWRWQRNRPTKIRSTMSSMSMPEFRAS